MPLLTLNLIVFIGRGEKRRVHSPREDTSSHVTREGKKNGTPFFSGCSSACAGRGHPGKKRSQTAPTYMSRGWRRKGRGAWATWTPHFNPFYKRGGKKEKTVVSSIRDGRKRGKLSPNCPFYSNKEKKGKREKSLQLLSVLPRRKKRGKKKWKGHYSDLRSERRGKKGKRKGVPGHRVRLSKEGRHGLSFNDDPSVTPHPLLEGRKGGRKKVRGRSRAPVAEGGEKKRKTRSTNRLDSSALAGKKKGRFLPNCFAGKEPGE